MIPWSNCLIWAYWQQWTCGGWVYSEKSQFGWWRHYAWTPDHVHYWCYVPTWPKEWWTARWWRRYVPPPLFRGMVKPGIR